MTKPLRALLVEDMEQDALLLLRELKRGGFDVTYERVDTPEAMSAALAKQPWDIVLSDYSMPQFSAPMALGLLQKFALDLPFIIVSGTVGEDIAVAAIHAGAHDFMAKGKLGRLIPAIERELRNVALRAEQKQLQEQLMVSDRMASVGILAAGVAHEINNPLAAVMGNLDLALREVTDLTQRLGLSGDLMDELRDARDGAKRIRTIVRDLKIFSRTEEETRGPVDTRQILESTLRMVWNEIRHRARLVEAYGDVPPVEANESRLGQVFLNLVVNAAHAIPEGHAADNEIRISTTLGTGRSVVVEIADTGSGMPPEVLKQLFTPFFTTKPVGEGTGLGLAICHRIVTDLGGSIEVQSEFGKGSLFRIHLPQATSKERPSAAPVAAILAARRRGRILVIDDEPMLGAVVRRALCAEHDVVTTTRALEALDRIAADERFDVILCDLMMPDVTGMDFHDELMRSVPEQAERVIFITGGAFTTRAREFLDGTTNPRLEKPFATQQLRALVNDRIR